MINEAQSLDTLLYALMRTVYQRLVYRCLLRRSVPYADAIMCYSANAGRISRRFLSFGVL